MKDAALDLLRPLSGKDQGTLGAIKQTMFARAVDTLTVPNPGASEARMTDLIDRSKMFNLPEERIASNQSASRPDAQPSASALHRLGRPRGYESAGRPAYGRLRRDHRAGRPFYSSSIWTGSSLYDDTIVTEGNFRSLYYGADEVPQEFRDFVDAR